MSGDGMPGLSDKLDRLFRAIPQSDGEPWTNEAAAKALADLGYPVSSQHLWHLRTGKRDNPSFRLMEGIAVLFGVPIGYFAVDSGAEVDVEELGLIALVQRPAVKLLLDHTRGVSDAQLAHVVGILKSIRGLENSRRA